jgi:uncharacterized protein
MRTFLDSSAFAKRFIDEAGSESVDAICTEASELALSIICVPEVISAMNRRVRERKLSKQQYDEAKKRLLSEVEDADIVNLSPSVVALSVAILEGNPIRAMDALHVASALQWQAQLFVSADEQQTAVAARAGLQTQLVDK